MGLFEGLLDPLFGSGGDSDSNKALAELQGLSLPQLKELHPELYRQVVSLNPELESAVTLGPSASEGITLDPKMQKAQMDALSSLMDITQNDGRDARFQADAQRLQNDVNQNLKGNTEAIMQNMATRGMSGGMSELVARQNSAQQGANRQAQMELDLNAQAQERALSALMNQGQLAGNMQNSDFNRQNTLAENKDAISKFNAANQQQVMSNNTQYKNNAQQANAQNAQNIANQNVDLNNSAMDWNSNGMAQQNYNNQLGRASGIADQYNNSANRKDAKKKENQGFIGNLVSSGAKAYAGSK